MEGDAIAPRALITNAVHILILFLIFRRIFFIANSKVFHISLDTFFWWMAK